MVKIEAAWSFGTLVNYHITILRHNSQDHGLKYSCTTYIFPEVFTLLIFHLNMCDLKVTEIPTQAGAGIAQ
jgi:hypothetical protein